MAGRLLRIAATLWMAWTLAGLLWLASGHSSVRLPAPPRAAHRTAPAVDVNRLAELNLFGAPPVVAAGGAAANAPDTTLQLRLAGVFVNPDPAQSSAIVAERSNPSAPAKLYRVNETLPGGATLSEVYDDRVLIRRGDGSSEVLRFEKTSLLNSGSPAASPGEGDADKEVPERDDAPTDVRSSLDNAVHALTVAPEAFVQQMGLKGGSMGYEVTDNTPEDLRKALGLNPGDRVLSLNGHRLGNPRQDREVLAGLKTSGAARVEIQRGGQIVTIERKF